MGGIVFKHAPKMRLAHHDEMVEALPANGTDKSVGIAVLPGRSGCRWSLSDSHRFETQSVCVAVGPIAITDEALRRPIRGECLRYLPRNPFGGWARRDVCRDDQPAIDTNDDQHKEHAQIGRWGHEENKRSDACGVVAEKGLPALRWWPASLGYVSGHCGLAYFEAKLQHVTTDPGCAPERLVEAHVPDETAKLQRFLRPTPPWPRSPTPIRAKARAMPSNDRIRANDGDSSSGAWEQPIDQNEDQAIEAAQSLTPRRLPSKDAQLMSKNENFGLEPSSRLNPWRYNADQKANRVKHHHVGYPDASNCLRPPLSTSGTTRLTPGPF